MALIRANHTHHTVAANDFAVAADFFDRSRNFHFFLLKLSIRHCTFSGSTYRAPLQAVSTLTYLFIALAPEDARAHFLLKGRFKVGLFKQGFVLLAHHVVLYLRHEIHRYNHNDQ